MRSVAARDGRRRRRARSAARLGAALWLALAAGCGDDESVASAPKRAQPPSEPPAGLTAVEWGQRLFRREGCIACHGIDGWQGIGGSLRHVWGRRRPLAEGREITADAEYVRRALLEPNAEVVAGFEPRMPSYADRLSDAEVQALVAYVKSLR